MAVPHIEGAASIYDHASRAQNCTVLAPLSGVNDRYARPSSHCERLLPPNLGKDVGIPSKFIANLPSLLALCERKSLRLPPRWLQNLILGGFVGPVGWVRVTPNSEIGNCHRDSR